VNYIIHFLEFYEAWKVDIQWVATQCLNGSDLEFERMLDFKELYCRDFEAFFYEKRFLDIISEAKLFVLEQSSFILSKKNSLKYISIYYRKGMGILNFCFYHQEKL